MGLSTLGVAVSFALEGWETNMDAAKKKAAEEKKGLFIEFTGSDWCPPCIQMRSNVLNKKEFLDAAQKGFVLVELDYPNKPLSAEQTEHNAKYAKDYGIQAYPTIIFTDSEGRPVQSLTGGRDLQEILKEIAQAEKNKVSVKESMAKLKDAKGDARKQIVDDLLKVIPVTYIKKFYPELLDDAKAGSGDVSRELRKQEQSDDFAAYLENASKESLDDPEKFYNYIGDYLKKDGLDASIRQQALSIQANLLIQMGRMDDGIKAFDEAIACDPGSSIGTQLATVRKNIEENKDMIAKDMEQRKKFRDYMNGLSQEVTSDPVRYKEALEKYIKENDLSPEMKAGIVQQIAIELIGQGKTDQALEIIQKLIDEDLKADEKSIAETLTQLKEYITANREALEEELKKK